MRNFFLNLLRTMMYSSFILAAIFLLILVSSLESTVSGYGLNYEPAPKYNPKVPLNESLEMLVNSIFDSLNINLEPTSIQICVTLIAFFFISGFISRFILKNIEYQQN